MANPRLIATNLLYKPLSNESFDAVKKSFFAQQWSDYAEKEWLVKWAWLKNAFCDVIPHSDIKTIVAAFMELRLAATDSVYVLSREQCLDYIERFYFLYQNNDPVFGLSHPEKASLLSLLRDAMTNRALCEPGRYIRFESIIMEFRADKNWIDNLLQNQRYLIITALHEAYDGDVHTLGVMQQIAHEKNLGIIPLHQLSDVYMSRVREKNIKAYFQEHYEIRFAEYEDNVVKNLSEHILFKMSALLKENQVDISQWNNNGVVFPNGYKIELIPHFHEFDIDSMEKDTLYLYLQGMHFQDEQLYGITSRGTPFPIVEPFKQIAPNPNEVKPTLPVDFEEIKRILKNGERYTLPDSFQEQLIISSLSERGAATYLAFNNAFLKLISDYLKVSNMSEIKTAFFDEPEDDQWVLKPKQDCLARIQTYVEKLLIEQQYFIPLTHFYNMDFDFHSALRLKKSVTLEEIETVSQQLRESMNSKLAFLMTLHQESVSNVLLNYPFVLLRQINNQFSWLTDLPAIYQSNILFMDELIQFFTLKIEALPEINKERETYRMVQHLLNIMGEQTDYLDRLPESFHQHPWIEPLLTEHKQAQRRNKSEVIDSLTTTPNIPLSQLIRLTQRITPREFESILQNRLAITELDALPYCNNPTFFSQFCQELLASAHWNNYLAYKQQFIKNQSTKPAAVYFMATEYWFLAYMRYQHHHTYFNSQFDVQNHLKQIRLSLHKLFNFNISVGTPMSIMFAFLFYFPPENMQATDSKKNISLPESAKICANKLFDENNASIASFMEVCGTLLPYVNLNDRHPFLEACIQILTHNSSRIILPKFTDQCIHNELAQGVSRAIESDLLIILAVLTLISILMCLLLLYLDRNPFFSNNNLIFPDEFKRFFKRAWGSICNTPDLLIANDLLTRCEDNIFRLEGLDNHSAHQKSALLKDVLNAVKEETHNTKDNDEVAQRLQEERLIIHQGKTHRLSFFTVAAQKRHKDSFDFTIANDRSGKPTKTIAHLTAAPFTHEFKPVKNQENNNHHLQILDRM